MARIDRYAAQYRVALADDHPIVLDGLEQLFRLEDDISIVARCRNADEALRVLRTLEPDVLMLDLLMPGGGGLELLRAVGDRARAVRPGERPDLIQVARDASEPVWAARFRAAIASCARGTRYLPPSSS